MEPNYDDMEDLLSPSSGYGTVAQPRCLFIIYEGNQIPTFGCSTSIRTKSGITYGMLVPPSAKKSDILQLTILEAERCLSLDVR